MERLTLLKWLVYGSIITVLCGLLIAGLALVINLIRAVFRR
jgi:hypothetical protein